MDAKNQFNDSDEVLAITSLNFTTVDQTENESQMTCDTLSVKAEDMTDIHAHSVDDDNNSFTKNDWLLKTNILLLFLSWVNTQDIFNEKPNNQVYLLDLDNVIIDGFHGTIDATTLELFGNVETLTIQNCNATSFKENFLLPLKNLKKLITVNSHYDRVKNNISTCCEQLREIELIGSTVGEIDDISWKKLAAMPNLKRLHFRRMQVPRLMSKTLEGSSLERLEIIKSGLETIEDCAFDSMNKLEVLNLQDNKLTSIPTASLAALKSLKELNLRGNLLKKVTAADIPSLPNLEKLNIGHNPITEIDLKGLREKVPNIKEINVSGINIDLSEAENIECPLFKEQIV